MDVGLIFILLPLFLLFFVLLYLSLQQPLDSLRKGSDVTVDESWTEFFDEIIYTLHCSPTDFVIIIFSHDGEETGHDDCAEVFLEGLWVPGCAGKALFDWRNNTIIPGFDESDGKIGVAVTDLYADVLIEVLVMLFEQSVGLFEVGSELQGTSLSEFTKGMDGCCFFVLLSYFLGSDIHLFLIFGVRIETKVFLLCSGVFLRLTSSNNNRNEVVKDNFEHNADGISDEVEEGESSLTNLRILFDSQQLVNSLHSSHNVGLVEGLTVGILLLAEDIGQFAQHIQVLSTDCVEFGAGRQSQQVLTDWKHTLQVGLKLLFSHIDCAADGTNRCCFHERGRVGCAQNFNKSGDGSREVLNNVILLHSVEEDINCNKGLADHFSREVSGVSEHGWDDDCMVVEDIGDEVFGEVAEGVDGCSTDFRSIVRQSPRNQHIHDGVRQILLHFLSAALASGSENEETSVDHVGIFGLDQRNCGFE